MMNSQAANSTLRADADWKDQRVVVLGLGRSGRGACRLLHSRGAAVIAVDDRAREELGSVSQDLGSVVADWRLGGEALDWTDVDAVVVSPGVPRDHPILRRALRDGRVVMGELELATRLVTGPIVAVTGTNGKSTTVTLARDMIAAAGRAVRLVGNIGTAISEEVLALEAEEVVVVEVSSFQLEWIDAFHPRAAAVLNLAPDHLNRYRDFEDYAAAKQNILRNLDQGDLFVRPSGDARLRAWSDLTAARTLVFGSDIPDDVDGVYVRGDEIWLRDSQGDRGVVSVREIPLLGEHNLWNVLASIALVSSLGIDLGAAAQAIRQFQPLAHRAEDVPVAGAVRWVDDSKATNVHAAMATAAGFADLSCWLLGGSGKQEDYSPLRGVAQRCDLVVCFGAERARIAEAIGDATRVVLAASLGQALEIAAAEVGTAGTVLLSPACASFDEFRSFEERGDFFVKWVRDRCGVTT